MSAHPFGPGTTPPGASTERQAATWVKQMFATVAPRYDLLNHLLSFNIDRAWRKRLLTRIRPFLSRPNAVAFDLCCGTGDVLLDLQSISPTPVLGADFCHPMLIAAAEKIARRRVTSKLFEADALQLPIREESLDLITISFGFRNLANYRAGLAELFRVLKPGGALAILEFSHPPGRTFGFLYGFYSRAILPVIGQLVSGSRDAYTYLPDSIGKFPVAGSLARMMEEAGFTAVTYEYLTGGIAALHVGAKPPA